MQSLTWVQGVTGNISAFQPVGQLPGEEHITEFAVTVGLKAGPGRLGGHHVCLWSQQLEVDAPEAVQESRHGDDSAGAAAPEPLQQEVGQQEVTQVVDPKGQAEALLSAARTYNT